MVQTPANENNLTTPVNKSLESGSWTQSIIWSPNAPFRDFTHLEFNHEDDIVPEDRTGKYLFTYSRLSIENLYCQSRQSDQGNDCEQTLDLVGTNSISPTTNSTK